MPKGSSYHIIRVSMGITFLWIGIQVLKEPLVWGAYLHPWAASVLPVSLETAMIATAVLDALIGVCFLIDRKVWLASGIAALHLALVLVTVGINSVIVRDIGLLGACVALFWSDLPHGRREAVKQKVRFAGEKPLQT